MPDKILIVDDDDILRGELKDALEGYDVLEASHGRAALAMLKKANEIGVIILDVMMPGLSGLDALNEIKRTDPDLGIIMLTGHSSKDVAIEALKGRADDYIEKPADAGRLREAVERLLSTRRGETDGSVLDLKGKIEKVKRFIEKNRYKKITLREAADAVCLSPKYLSRIFKDHTRTGFTDYKLAVKIRGAKDLLKKDGYNINQISEKLGYENTESFIRQFKKIAKCTPTVFRHKIRKRPAKKRRS